MKFPGKVIIRIEQPRMFVRFHDLGIYFPDVLQRFKDAHQGSLRWNNTHADRTKRYWQGSSKEFQNIYRFCLQYFTTEQIEVIWGSDRDGYHQESMFS